MTARDAATDRPKLLRGVDPIKDQSYFLSAISEEGLSRTLFPIGHLTKPEVRQMAKDFDLPTADRPESMGLCFIGKRGKFSKFIGNLSPSLRYVPLLIFTRPIPTTEAWPYTG